MSWVWFRFSWVGFWLGLAGLDCVWLVGLGLRWVWLGWVWLVGFDWVCLLGLVGLGLVGLGLVCSVESKNLSSRGKKKKKSNRFAIACFSFDSHFPFQSLVQLIMHRRAG